MDFPDASANSSPLPRSTPRPQAPRSSPCSRGTRAPAWTPPPCATRRSCDSRGNLQRFQAAEHALHLPPLIAPYPSHPPLPSYPPPGREKELRERLAKVQELIDAASAPRVRRGGPDADAAPAAPVGPEAGEEVTEVAGAVDEETVRELYLTRLQHACVKVRSLRAQSTCLCRFVFVFLSGYRAEKEPNFKLSLSLPNDPPHTTPCKS